MAVPEVSVIIPTHNRAAMLLRAVRSVLEQTYQDFELIIVDDGSTDNTEENIRQISDLRIAYIKLEEKSGSSARPRNIGISRAKGKYIALLDSDDEWMPDLLQRLVQKMETAGKGVEVVYCGLIVLSSEGKVTDVLHPRLRGKLWPQMLADCAGSISASLIHRQCFDKAGLFDEGNIIPHWDMWIRLARDFGFDYIPEALALYHCHHGQASKQAQSLKLEAILRKYAEAYAQHPKEQRKARYRLGLSYCREGNRRKCLRYALPSLIHDKHSWKPYVLLVLMLISPKLLLPLSSLYQRLTGLFKSKEPDIGRPER